MNMHEHVVFFSFLVFTPNDLKQKMVKETKVLLQYKDLTTR